jgi:hypothetical protein
MGKEMSKKFAIEGLGPTRCILVTRIEKHKFQLVLNSI